jgi:two-component system sensor histidine kinase/response regulator
MGCVLVVDDRQADRDLLATVIGGMGHRVFEAPNPERALELTRAHRPDLVITDLQMPAMNGYEFVRDLRSDHRVGETPVIFRTANYAEDEVRALAASCDVSGFLPKPCEPQTIITVVGEALGLPADGSPRFGTVGEDFDGEQRQVLKDKLVRKVCELEAANVRLARTALDLQRSNDDLEQFAYLASHDLSEPIRSVSGMVQLLAKRYQGRLEGDADLYISHAVEASKRMQTLIHDLLEYSRAGQSEMRRESVDCSAIVGEVLDSLQGAIAVAGAQITTDALPAVRGDSTQLRRVFQNLIANGVKFQSESSPRIRVGAVRDAEAWRFSIIDNGIGIAPRHARRVFEVFKRLHGGDTYSGSGIGLSICKRIVERHGGRIWVEPAGDGGSQFLFTIPDTKEAR